MSTTGWHHTDESKSKISTSLKGRKRPHDVMEKTRLKNIGQTRTPEQRARMSAAHKGKPSHPMSPETREMLMKINIGKIVSQETRERMSQSQKGRVVSDETKLKISKSTKGRTGKKHSLESRAKMSVSKMGKPSPMKGIPMSLESRQRMSIAKKGKPNLSKRGEKNPNWNGGSSYGKYCPKFNERFKSGVRKYQNNTCQICGFVWTPGCGKRRHTVHHVYYNKGACCTKTPSGKFEIDIRGETFVVKGDPNKFVLTCSHGCHQRTNYSRVEWATYFENLVNEKFKGKSYYTHEELDKMVV